MKQYEMTIVFGEDFLVNRRDKVFSSVEDVLKKNKVKLLSYVEMGKKRLAYPIKKCKDGFFGLYNFECDSDVIKALKKTFMLNEAILTFIILQKKFESQEEQDQKNNESSDSTSIDKKTKGTV